MKFLKLFLPLFILFLYLVSCNNGSYSNTTNGNPAPKDFLTYKNADIFLLEGIVYSKAQDVKWVAELKYNLGEQIGETTSQTDKASFFKNGSANKLPIGTKIYETDTPAYIVILNGEQIPYLKMLEG
jgi:hypothetical protein